MNYGLTYMGSKNRIARDIVEQLPSAEYFVDLFCGGCAVTHAAMLSGKYKKFIVNDIAPDMPCLFVDAINGKYRNEKRWISREDFERLKDTDAYVRTCWSFGNGGYTYSYGRKIEPWKKALHYARVFGDFSLLKRNFGIDTNDASKQNIAKNADTWKLRDKLKRLQSLQSLKLYNGDYQEVKIPADSCVYCDPPYGNCDTTIDKRTYCKAFDFPRFFDWIRTRDFPVYISEYAMPDDFVSVWSRNKTCSYGANTTGRPWSICLCIRGLRIRLFPEVFRCLIKRYA